MDHDQKTPESIRDEVFPDDQQCRLDAEWMAVSAFRDTIRLATHGNSSLATYANALDLGAELVPELLGDDVSLLRRAQESSIVREMHQRAQAESTLAGVDVSPADVAQRLIAETESLLAAPTRGRKDTLRLRLKALKKARDAFSRVRHSENQLIFRDAYRVERDLPVLVEGAGFRDFHLEEEGILRVRVLHPEKVEHLSGADIIYERHNLSDKTASIVAVQYKIWKDRVLHLTDSRMQRQLDRLRSFLCDSGLCNSVGGAYRLPCCAAFLRPTDQLQSPDQKLISSGQHLPVCHIDRCAVVGPRGAKRLTLDSIRKESVGPSIFEQMFVAGKLGSRPLSHAELDRLYRSISITDATDRLLLYLQELGSPSHQRATAEQLLD